MKRLIFLAAALIVALGTARMAPAADSARNWTYKYLLATAETERALAPIVEHIVSAPELNSVGLLDVAAESLLARLDDPQFPVNNKIRLIRVLGDQRGPRYHAVLRQVLARSDQPTVQKAARKALPGKESSNANSYVPGSVDLHALVGELESAALAARPTTSQGEHLAKFPGGTIDELFAWAGRPHQVVSGQTRVSDGLFVRIKIQRLTFFYRGLGRVVYGYRPKYRTWDFRAIVADPLAFEREFPYRERAAQLGMPNDATLEMIQLVSNSTAAMRIAVTQRAHLENSPQEFLDTAAEILLQQHAQARDAEESDAFAWICRLLRQHGGVRYAGVLARVADETGDLKLYRFASLPRNEPADMSKEPYTPGTVSLDAQRAKYPSLYPDSTYTSGHL